MLSPSHVRTEHTPPWSRLTDWMLRKVTGLPSGGKKAAVLWICGSILAVGVIDYQTGTRLSMTLLYLVPVGLAVIWLGFTAGWVTAVGGVAIRLTADLVDEPESFREAWLWWNSGASIFVYLSVVWILDALIRLHRHLEQRVVERTMELQAETLKRQQVQSELLDLSANERGAMGRELHDQLGQHLVGTAMAAQVLAQRLQAHDENGAKEARTIVDLVEQGVAQTRQLARGLLLENIEPERLRSEIEELCATLRQQFPRVNCDALVQTPERLRDPAVAAQVYRIAQEAMRNACRHSGARRVRLGLRESENKLCLSVEDDGKGLPDGTDQARGMGLRIMQHRAEKLGSRLVISSQPGRGTRITCELSLE